MILRHGAAALLGAGVCLASVAEHRSEALGLPLGLVLAVSGSLASAGWLRASRRPRLTVSYAVGWLVVFALAVRARPEGDYVLASDLDGYAMMLASLLVGVIAVSAFTAPPNR